MKQLFTLLFLSITLNGYCQQIDYRNIDFSLLDRLILEEVNERRRSAGKSTISFSKVIYNGVSKKQTHILLTEERVYHPNKKHLYDNILIDLKNECYKNHMILIDTSRISYTRNTEVSIMITLDNKIKTYQELSKYFVETWLSSHPHKCIIMGYRETRKLNPGAVSIQLGSYNGYSAFYGTLQITGPIIL